MQRERSFQNHKKRKPVHFQIGQNMSMKSGLEVKNGNANLTRYLTHISRGFLLKIT